MSDLEVRRIGAEETVGLRWPVLRAGMPRESAIFEGDEQMEAVHIGAYREGCLVGVVSIYPRTFPDRPDAERTWQLRGMAVAPEVQRGGVGGLLLRAVEEELPRAGGRTLWCNARVPAKGFYEKHGWQVLGGEFDIPTAGPHVRMWKAVEEPA